MILSLRRAFLASLLLVLLAGSVSAADAPAVRDEAALFSPAAVRKADEDISAIKKGFGIDMRVQTFKTVPEARLAEFKEMSPAQRNKFFTNWALERLAAEKVHGVYVLICKTPGHLQIEVDQETQKKAFTGENVKAMRDAMLASFKAKDFDQGLRAGVGLFGDKLASNVPPTQRLLVRREVKDYAGFFSPAAVQKANAVLQALPRQPGKDVAIETFPTPPQAEKVASMSPAQRNKYFKDWADRRAVRSNLEGVLVLICKQPGHLQVDVRGSAARKLLSPADTEKLEKELRSRLSSGGYDRGLADAVESLRAKLAQRALASVPAPRPVPTPITRATPTAAPTPTAASTQAKTNASGQVIQAQGSVPAGGNPEKKDPWDLNRAKEKVHEVAETRFETWKWVAGILAVLALWILVGIVRALFRRKQPPPPVVAAAHPVPPATASYRPGTPTYPPVVSAAPASRPPQTAGYPPAAQASYPVAAPPAPAAGGGGFMSGMLGGMFGAAAGNWIYDSFRRGGTPAGPGPTYHPPTQQPASPPPSASHEDAYNRGGDFGAAQAPAPVSYGAGGDFDAPPQDTADAGGGGEFGTPAPTHLGGGGDFGRPEPAEGGGGGDFDSPQSADLGGGGDFDSSATADAGGGGDFGSEPPAAPEQVAQNDAGGDYGAGGSFDSPAPADQGGSGGDFGSDVASSDTGSDQGGDFG